MSQSEKDTNFQFQTQGIVWGGRVWEQDGALARSRLYLHEVVLQGMADFSSWAFLSSPSVHEGDAFHPRPSQIQGPLPTLATESWHLSLALGQKCSTVEIRSFSISGSPNHKLLPSRLQTGIPTATLLQHKRSLSPSRLAGDFMARSAQ